MDIQGADVARPWIEKANSEFTALVDEDNRFGSFFNYNFVPITMLFNEDGKLIRGPKYANVDDPGLIGELEDWIKNGDKSAVVLNAELNENEKISGNMVSNGKIVNNLDNSGAGFASKKAEDTFRIAVSLLKHNDKAGALQMLKEALELDPDNYLIRKQIWAVENPEKFYDGDIDLAWQREIMKKKK